jgi:hypothetical protein
MKKRTIPIGEILSELGRITPEDIQRALAYQRESGGLFGDALVSLGLISPEEVRFALADQYDLPFVHLRPEQIDWVVARTVPAEWAREHEMLPVLRDGDVVTVIATGPPTEDEVATIRRFARAERIEAAVSSPETIHTLIEAVHGEMAPATATLDEWVEGAMGAGAAVLGISVRGERAQGWFRAESGGAIQTLLNGEWEADLKQMLSPLFEGEGGQIRSWPAILSTADGAWRVECSLLRNGVAIEFALRVDAGVPSAFDDAVATPELRAAVRAAGRTTLRACQPDDGVSAGVLEAMLPNCPAALLHGSVRTLHISDRPVAVPAGVLTLQSDGALGELIASLERFTLDALTLDVAYLRPEHIEQALRSVPLVVFRELPTVSKRIRADRAICLRGEDRFFWTSLS